MLGIVQTEKAKRLVVLEDETFGVWSPTIIKRGAVPAFQWVAGSGRDTLERRSFWREEFCVEESIHFHELGEESCF